MQPGRPRRFVISTFAAALTLGFMLPATKGLALVAGLGGQQGLTPARAAATTRVTLPIAPGGGSFDLPERSGVSGAIDYASNVAAAGTSLTVALGPFTGGTRTVLSLELRVSGTRVVTFGNDARRLLAIVRSRAFPDGTGFEVRTYAGARVIRRPYAAGTSFGGTLMFESPLRGLSIAPGRPLVIEFVAVAPARPAPAAKPTSKSTSAPLVGTGGGLQIPAFDGYFGRFDYNPNNAAAGVALTLTNSGSNNLFSVPPPASGTAALYLYASVDGSASVAFTKGGRPITVHSPHLVNGQSYAVYLYTSNGRSAGTPYSAGTAVNGTLTFVTPLRSITLVPFSPLVIVLSEGATIPVVTVYQIRTRNLATYGIAQGSDGNMWFSDVIGNYIGRISTSGGVRQFPIPHTSSNYYGIALGPDSAMWFTEYVQSAVGRITTGGQMTEYPIQNGSGSGPDGIALGPDSNLWVTLHATNRIAKLDPTTGIFTQYPTPTTNSNPFGIAAGPDGALWFAEFNGNNIGRIDTSGNIREFGLPTFQAGPSMIAAGPDNALWYTEFLANNIGRIDTSGNFREYQTPTRAAEPEGIALGPDGALWFVEHFASKIGRIDPATGSIVEFPVPGKNSGPEAIARGADNAMWFTEYDANNTKIGHIGRISVPGFSTAPTR